MEQVKVRERNHSWLLLFVASIFVSSGCGGPSGPQIGRVQGQVTFDGAPLPGAELIFIPVAEARASRATADEKGYYTLQYTFDKQGALVGEHRVQINSTSLEGESAKDPLLPASYNSDSQLRVDVKPGRNTIDFQLTPEGAIPSK